MANQQGGKKRSIVVPVILCLLAAVLIGLNIAAVMFDSTIDHYAPGGGNPATVTKVAGSESWDSEYYTSEYRGRNQATKAAEELVTTVEGEGIVLMKNKDNTLPLPSGTKVTLMGRYAADPIYGGAGSGTVDPASCIDFLAGLTQAGLTVNDALYQHALANLESYPKASIVMDSPQTSTYYTGEIPWADYPASAKNGLSGTTAVVVLGRGGGEGGDLSQDLMGTLNSGVSSEFKANAETANYTAGQHQLELTREEMDLIAAAKQNCDKVVVVLNLSTTMELGPLVEEGGVYEADAIIEVGSIGSTGAAAVGQILTGAVNPSGHTTDLWAADFTKDPTFNNFGDFKYTDVSGFYTQTGDGAYFVEYEEGIYMGYRYYETAAAEGYINYDEAVVFPFGYGLSYTTFEQKLDSAKVDGDKVVASVTVTNTGSVAGKTPVQIYYSAPYTKGGLEKSAVVLGNFEKTKLLEPGESQTLEVSFPVRDMASWDSAQGAYVQDAGNYVISLRDNSHDVIAEETIALQAEVYKTDSATGNEVSNKFDDTTAYMKSNTTNFSRGDFAGTFPDGAENATTSDKGITVAMFDAKAYAEAHSDVAMPTTGASNGLSLIDLRGKPKDDPSWDLLLDQITVDEMVTVLNDGAYNTGEIPSISKPKTSDPDGPAGFTSLMGSTGNCAWCSEVVMAQTWNKELMYQVGQMIGQEALASGYNGWYAPAMNTHRSPFAGRNFEYYSEDPVLGGQMAAAVVRGAMSNGCYAYIKHFALNDQETRRTEHIMTWASEQAIREIYLRPFEYCVKADPVEIKYIADDQGTVATAQIPGCLAVMSSFNFIGTEWAGGRESLMTGILRDEWGFQGFAITDFNLYDYMNKNQGFYGGTDHMLTIASFAAPIDDTTSAPAVASMRNSMRNMLYTVANSNAMNGMTPGTKISYGLAPWQMVLYGVTGVGALGILFGLWRWFKGGKKNGGDDGTKAAKVAATAATAGAAAAAGAKAADKKAADAEVKAEKTAKVDLASKAVDAEVKAEAKAKPDAEVASVDVEAAAKAAKETTRKTAAKKATAKKAAAKKKADVVKAEADIDAAAKKKAGEVKAEVEADIDAAAKKASEVKADVKAAADKADEAVADAGKKAAKKAASTKAKVDAKAKEAAVEVSAAAEPVTAEVKATDAELGEIVDAAADKVSKVTANAGSVSSVIIDRRLLGAAQGLSLDPENITGVLTDKLKDIKGIDFDGIASALKGKLGDAGVGLTDVIEILKEKIGGIAGIDLEEIIRALIEKAQELIK